MKQVKLLPSGCQQWNRSIIRATKNKFYYCSTLACYVINGESFNVEKILSVSEKLVTSIDISPHDNNKLVSSSMDGSLYLWDVQTEQVCVHTSVDRSLHLPSNYLTDRLQSFYSR